jgi:phosphomevalonate kinase
MEPKYKVNQIVILLEITEQRYYPAIINGVRITSENFDKEFIYLISVDYGDEKDNQIELVQTEVVERFLYPFSKLNELK